MTGADMRRLRERAGLNQVEFAKRLGYGRAAIAQIETEGLGDKLRGRMALSVDGLMIKLAAERKDASLLPTELRESVEAIAEAIALEDELGGLI